MSHFRRTTPHTGVLMCTLLAGFIAVNHLVPRALAESSGTGSVVGDNIEAEVSFASPPASAGPTCEWRPALDITAGAKPGTAAISVRTSQGVVESLYLRVCGDHTDTYYWIRNDVGPRVAKVAKDKVSRLVPALLVHTAPSPERMVVKQPTWFWVPRAIWKPISITAAIPTPAGPIIVTTTATPRHLSYSPGDGRATVTCTGPGKRWRSSMGDDVRSSCSYSYRSASRSTSSTLYPARVSVRWDVSWKSNLGAGGSLPPIRTGLGMNVRVAELQALSR